MKLDAKGRYGEATRGDIKVIGALAFICYAESDSEAAESFYLGYYDSKAGRAATASDDERYMLGYRYGKVSR